MLSRFHLIPERYGQTDGQICYINIATRDNKKLSYRREAVRCLVLLSIFVSR